MFRFPFLDKINNQGSEYGNNYKNLFKLKKNVKPY